jgi:hypothetical protein
VGDRIGDEFQVNSDTQNDQRLSAIAALGTGGFVVAWTSSGQDSSGLGVFAQVFHADGTRRGDEFQVNTFSEYDQSNPSVASLMNRGFVITWHSQGQDGHDWGVFGQCFDNQGRKAGMEYRINTTILHAQPSPAIQSISNSEFIVIWTSKREYGQDIYGQRFGYDGSKIGEEFQVNSQINMNHLEPSISVFNGSGFMVTWNTHVSPENRWGIYGQLFDDKGAKEGKVFQVATYTGGDQSFYSQDMLSCGKYVLTWCTGSQQTEYKGIYGQQLMVIDKPGRVQFSDETDDSDDDNKGCMVNLLTN